MRSGNCGIPYFGATSFKVGRCPGCNRDYYNYCSLHWAPQHWALWYKASQLFRHDYQIAQHFLFALALHTKRHN
jgi:hypothetical protein